MTEHSAESLAAGFDIDQKRHVHIVGIGGAGMSAIAILLLSLGHEVSGSDFRESRFTRHVKSLGARVFIGHRPDYIEGADAVAISSAVRDTNPELRAAREAGIPVLRRSEILALITARWRTVAIAGTHGKTTVSSMLAAALDGAGLNPSYLIGGELNESGSNAHRGTGEILVCEADESDGTFLKLGAEAVVVTNVEPDHLEHYGDFASLKSSFREFLESVRSRPVVCLEDPGAAEVASGLDVVSYGFADDCFYEGRDLKLSRGGARFFIAAGGEGLGYVQIGLPGRHNALNALGAAAAALELGAGFAGVRRGLAGYQGVGRRFEWRGESNQVTFVDDYAHLPTEVEAALAAAATGGFERVVAVFQPHLYSRTATYADGFGSALAAADLSVVADVFAAREDPVPGVSGALVADAIRDHGGDAVYVAHRSELAREVAGLLKPGDLCLSVGAGDITTLADELVSELAGGAESDPVARAADRLAEVLRVPPRRDMPLAQLTMYRVGGSAALFVEVEDLDELLAVRAVIHDLAVPPVVVGRGSNMLIADSGFSGIAVQLGAGFSWVEIDPDAASIRAGASTPLPHLARQAGRAGLAGLEFGVGVPASVGGAVRMNAGGHGSEIVDVLSRAAIVNLETDAGQALGDNGVEERAAADLGLSYRHSNLRSGEVVAWAEFSLEPGDPAAIDSRQFQIVNWRKENQPGGPGNAGSVFKNPDGDSAGRLIDSAGCKGLAVGGASVSDVHANFIVTESWARAADVLGVIRAVQERVREVHGIELEPEVRLIGEFP